jgi:hypothetical protein
MGGTNPELQRAAIQIVSANQPAKPYYLLGVLRREYGASHRAANETLFALLRSGHLKRTFTGKLRVG